MKVSQILAKILYGFALIGRDIGRAMKFCLKKYWHLNKWTYDFIEDSPNDLHPRVSYLIYWGIIPLGIVGFLLIELSINPVTAEQRTYQFLNSGPVLPVMGAVGLLGIGGVAVYQNNRSSDSMTLPAKIRDGGKSRLMQRGIELSRNLSILISGITGSGKTTTMKQLLPDMVESPTICYDPKGDFEEFFNSNEEFEDRNIYILNPDREDSVNWDVFCEIREPSDYENVADRLIPPTDDDYWHDSAARVLEAMLRKVDGKSESPRGYMIDNTLEELEDEDLAESITGYRGGNEISDDGGKRTGSITSTLRKKPRFENCFTAEKYENTFSIRDFVAGEYGEDSILLIQIPSRKMKIYGAIVSFVLDWSIDLSTDAVGKNRAPHGLNLVADEIARLPRMSNLEQLVSLGRGSGATAIIGLQSYGQLAEKYGRNMASAIIENSVQAVFQQTKNRHFAQQIQARIGKEEVEKESKSYDHEGNQRTSYRTQREYPVSEGEIMKLDTGEAIVDVQGPDWYKAKIRMKYE